jgi:3-hydroxymyristoyl/3-hydroxydecanoyl-(acyl carrier protein) dehydratase
MVAAWERDLQDSGLAVAARAEWHLDEAPGTAGSARAPFATLPDWMPIVSALELDRSARRLACRLLVPYDLAIFRGHFPSTPIVPGVLQVGWAVELAREHALADGRCRGISTVKFRRIVQPGMCLGARVEGGPRDNELQFTYEMDGAVITTGRLRVGGGRG